MATMKVKSSDPESQGPFVLIEEDEYDPTKHELYEADAAPKARARPDGGAASATKPKKG